MPRLMHLVFVLKGTSLLVEPDIHEFCITASLNRFSRLDFSIEMNDLFEGLIGCGHTIFVL